MIRDNFVSKVTGYGFDGPSSVPSVDRDFALGHRVQTVCGAHFASYAKGTRGCLPVCKAVVEHSPSPSAEDEKTSA
jgi:hypothetical protein